MAMSESALRSALSAEQVETTLSELPLNVYFSVGYLDGVMKGEPAEIARQWRVVREHLASLASSLASTLPETVRRETFEKAAMAAATAPFDTRQSAAKAIRDLADEPYL